VLSVLHVAYPLAPVSLDATGGAEQIMALLDRALIARGHRSIAIACAGSSTAGLLLPVPVEDSFNEASQLRARVAFGRQIVAALERWDIDLVHMHGIDFYEYLPPVGIPVLATLHLPISYYPDSVFRISRPATYLNCVSKSQQRTCPPCSTLMDPIENGIPLDLFPERRQQKSDYALALGRICPEKGFHLALEAAERAGVPLWIAGMVFPYAEHERYFEQQLLPRLSPPHRFLGPAGFADKIRLLSAARCLVVPSLARETSSLVAMEAMACGTPVVCFSSGALTDLVDHGRTGFVVQDTLELAAAMSRSEEIDGAECRREARFRFSAERMADQYLNLYKAVASHRYDPASSR
jgi:glycosyltransferase involved in cell wall biosynthesis